MSKAIRHVGSSLDDFLREKGILEEAPQMPSKRPLPSRYKRQWKPEKSAKWRWRAG